jgi:hypothetical protein
MLRRINAAAGSVESSASAVTDLATAARNTLSEMKAQVTPAVMITPAIVAGIGIVAIVALIVALVAVSRG